MASRPRVLIVGAGLGGLRAAEGLRAAGYRDEIVIVGDEVHLPYNRPPLSKAALSSEMSPDDLAFRHRDAIGDVVWRLGTAVTDIDLHERTAHLESGRTLGFDGLILATGVTARRLAIPGPPAQRSARRFVVRTIEDAHALRQRLQPGVRLVVVGAGFIGCEVAATAVALGCSVRCVALDDRPMVRPLGEALGAALQKRHEECGVRFHLGATVTAFLGRDQVRGVLLSDGTELGADVVVEALGSRCNSGLLDGYGFNLSDGVLVDGALRPLGDELDAADGVAVVGDVARFPNPRFGPGAWRVEHWSVPTDLGRRAGAVLAAYLDSRDDYDQVVSTPLSVMPSFWSDQYQLRIQSLGMPSLADPDEVRVLAGDLTGDCIVGYFQGDGLMGVVGVNMTRELNQYRAAVGVVNQSSVANQSTMA